MDAARESANVLVVDADTDARNAVATSLRALGFRVSEAEDGHRALAQAAATRLDIVLLDVLIPDSSGFDVCRRLRTLEDGAALPIIMITELNDKESIDGAYACGATDVVTKPIHLTLLAHRIRYALRIRRAQDEIDRHREKLADAQRIARLGSWTWVLKDHRFECSDTYWDVVGAPVRSLGRQWRDVLAQVHPEDVERLNQAMDAALTEGTAYAIEYRTRRQTGAVRTLLEQASACRDRGGQIVRIDGTTQDITDQVIARAQIQQLSDYDGLTGLANRKLFGDLAKNGINRCKRNGSHAAVLMINLDRFRRINDTFGHAAGDRTLQDIGQRIAETIRVSDTAATFGPAPQSEAFGRMSADTFAVFLSEINRPEDAALIARRLCDAIARPVMHARLEILLSASIGIAIYPENGAEPGTLIGNAESAMRRAKQSGAGTYCFFNRAMNAGNLAKLDMEADLRRALSRDELVLFYQPRVDILSAQMVGAEALLRWSHPRRGLVPPGEFIPVAEDSRLIVPMTEWVLRSACRQLREWRDAGLAVVPVSINFSAHSFREGTLPALIESSLREFGIGPHMVEVEITESMIMQDVDSAVARMKELRAIGIKLALDDFGTGYSSLAYLKRFPLNVLKIDRAFVKDVLNDNCDAAIASAIIAMGESLGMEVVAEGMEQPGQADFLRKRGCRFMQGYLFARPLPTDAFTQLLRDGISMPAGLDTTQSLAA